MLKSGLLNPDVLSLLARVRHTNMLVIADLGFPFWPMIETVDLSLVAGVPTIAQVLTAILPNFHVGQAYMAEEYLAHNDADAQASLHRVLDGVPLTFEAHEAVFKKRVPHAIGLIRTGDPAPYTNIILVSA
jgi:D-ribose pyranase